MSESFGANRIAFKVFMDPASGLARGKSRGYRSKVGIGLFRSHGREASGAKVQAG